MAIHLNVGLCLLAASVLVLPRPSEAGYQPIYGVQSQILYNNGSSNLFPRQLLISETDYEYFFSELNFNAVADRLITGAADKLYLFDLELNLLVNYTWFTDTATRDSCIASNSNPNYACRNHIRVYKVFPSNTSILLTCGTQAEGAPQCRSLTISGDSFVEVPNPFSVTSGVVVSYYPEFSNFGEFLVSDSNDQRFFSASFGSGNSDFLLSYQNVSTDPLQVTPLFSNLRNNDNWLKLPVTFVDYYRADYPVVLPATVPEDYQFYFIFLRENLVSSDIIYSRVVRICRNDPGLGLNSNDHFTTFMKARIFCEREVPPGREFTGSIDYQYNEINSVAFNENAGRFIESEEWNKRMYGAFTGASIGPSGTAICVYSADNSNDPGNHAGGFNRGVFDIFRENVQITGSAGAGVENSYVECNDGGRSAADSQLVEVVQDIAQIGQNPLLILNITVTQMVIDSVCVVRSGASNECLNQDVLFLGTDNGKVLKVVLATIDGNDFDPVIAEEIQLDDDNAVNRLSIQEDSSNTKFLYVNTFSRIYRLPLERCARFENDCSACIGSRDPYCVWNTTSLLCERNSLSAINDATGTVPNELKQNIHSGTVVDVCDRVEFSFSSSSYSVSESDNSVMLTVVASATGANASGLIEVVTENRTATADMDFMDTIQPVMFADGVSTAMVSIALISDSIFEGDNEQFTVRLRPTGAGLVTLTTTDVAIVTIIEDDTVTIGFESSAITAMEEEGYVNITLQKLGTSLVDNCIQLTTGDLSAIAGIDYLSISRQLTFAPEDTQQTIIVPLLNNDIVETSRNFSASLTPLPSTCAGVSVAMATSMATTSIISDDVVIVQFSNSTFTIREGVSCVPLIISKSGSTTLDFTLQITTTSGSADSSDFDVSSRTVTLAAAEAQTTVCVSITDDDVLEDTETFSVSLSPDPLSGSQMGLVVGERDMAIVEILEDPNDSVTLSLDDSRYSVSESSGFVEVMVMKEGESQVDVTVTLSTSTITASAPGDYSSVESQCLTFSPSDSTVTYRILIVDDNVVENMETFQINLNQATPSGVTLGTSFATVSIMDDDSVFIVFASDYTVSEAVGVERLSLIKFGSSNVPLNVTISTLGGSASVDEDYEPLESTTVMFGPSDQQQFVDIRIVNDAVFELTENFSIAVSASSPQIVTPSNITTITITDDEFVTIGFSSTEYIVSESAGNVSISVEIDTNIAVPLSVSVLATNGEATESDDYMLLNSTIIFTPDEATQQNITVQLVDDNALEAPETFSLQLMLVEDNDRITLDRNRATISISDDDSVTLSLNDSSYSVSESSGFVEVMVMKEGESQVDVTVTLSTSTITASAPGDYSSVESQCLTFSPSDSTVTYRILIVDDNVVENMETFQINLNQATPSGVTLGTSSTTVSIMDDDSVSIGFISDYTAGEAVGVQTIQLLKFGSSDVPLNVTISTLSGSASVDEDYEPLESTTVMFGPSDQQQFVDIRIVNDAVFELTENFSIAVSASSPQIVTPSNITTITITDDEFVTIGFSSIEYIVSESAGSVNISVESDTNMIAVPLSVSVLATNGEATDINVTFMPGETAQHNISIPLSGSDPTVLRLAAGVEDYEMVALNPDITIVSTTRDDIVTIGFSSTEYIVSESAGSVSISVEIDTNIAVPLSVSVLATNGEATESDDYMLLNSTIIFTPDEATQQNITVQLVDDNALEAPETFSLQLMLAEDNDRITLDPNRATISISDDDTVTLSLNDSSYSVSESSGFVEVMVMKEGESQVDVTVTLSTSTITASAPGDYSSVESQCLTFSPSDSTVTYRILIVDDNVVENMETFQINLNQATPSGVTLGASSTTVSILDDDSVSIGFISDYTAGEAVGVQTIQLLKFGSSDVPLNVTISTLGGSANADEDYEPLESTTVMFGPSDQQQFVDIRIVNDAVFELTENFSIAVSASSPQIVTPSNITTITITDDEFVTIGFSSTKYIVSESAGSVNISVESDTNMIAVPLSVSVLSTNREATDINVTFMPGETVQHNISIPLSGSDPTVLRLAEGVEDYEMVALNPDITIVSTTRDDSTTAPPMSTTPMCTNPISTPLSTSGNVNDFPPDTGSLREQSADELYGSYQTALIVLVILVVVIVILIVLLLVVTCCMFTKYCNEKKLRSRSHSPNSLRLNDRVTSFANKSYEQPTPTSMTFAPLGEDELPGLFEKNLAASSIEAQSRSPMENDGLDTKAETNEHSKGDSQKQPDGNAVDGDKQQANPGGSEKITRL